MIRALLCHSNCQTPEPDHFRIVYLPRVDELAEIQEKMTRFLAQYRR